MKAGLKPFNGFTCALLLLSVTAFGQTQRQYLRNNVPGIVNSLNPLGTLAETNMLNLAIGLPLRNREALADLLGQIYDPSSPNYHHYLTTEQFTEQFGPTAADYKKLIAFANANGLHVTATHPNRMLLDVSGSVANVEQAFHVSMRTYPHPKESRNFFAPDTEPSLDLDVPVLHIGGLDNYSLPHPRAVARPSGQGQNISSNDGTGPDGSFMGTDFRKAYVPGTTLTGAGQVIGLLQFDGYDSNDIAYYETQAELPAVSLTNILINGFDGNPAGGEVEVCLDIEMAISMAPGLSKIIVYEAPNPSPFVDILNRMANDNAARQLSCSWYLPNGTSNAVADQIFQQMAAQGQSFFSASGDNDAYTNLIDFPGDSPYITQVGGTTLTTDGTGARSSESVWNWGIGIGSGGGISTQYPIPSWQTNISMTSNQGSTTKRNVPDVALTADNIYVRADGVDYNKGGTSAAAPLWAGFAALVNQRAAETGNTPVGFINPALDIIASGPNYSSAFNDITNGDNTSGTSPTKFYATTNYDLCTGWGTPKTGLIDLLAIPEPLIITPSNGFASSGAFGGPFTITSMDFTLTNAGTDPLNWSSANTSLWLNASISSGTLTPAGPATTVTINLNSVASNLASGNYSATVQFTNLSDGVVQNRQFSLSVIDPPVITMQPVSQSLPEGAGASFTVAATGGLPLFYQWQFNGTNLTTSGNVFGTTTTNLIINNVSSNNAGIYAVIATNSAGSVISSNAFLTITSSPPIFILQPTNQTINAGGTASFTALAIGSTPISYQWTKNGTNLDGQTGTNLTIVNAQTNDAGIYALVATNIYGTTSSSNALLSVQSPACISSPLGQVAWWRGANDAKDSIGTNNGTAVGAISYTNGEVGQAFVFNGSSYITIPASASLNVGTSNGFTIECWVKPSAGNNSGPVIEWDSANTDGTQFWVNDDNSLWVNIKKDPGNAYGLQTPPLINTNNFYHVAVTYDKSSGLIIIYTNGAVAASKNIGSVTPDTTYPANLGRRTATCCGNGYYYRGLIDELGLYNRALTATEIQNIYNAGSFGKCPLPPVIAVQPANQTVIVSNTATFTVVATGVSPFFYQWNFSGTNIPGATNASLVLTNVQFSQAGTYMVQVANTGGNVTSSNAILTVIPQPPCYGPPSGLVGWWPSESNANDVAGTNNGTLQNGASFTNGEVGKAFSFNGSSSSYVSILDSPTLDSFTNRITIETWIKVGHTNANPAWQSIISKGNAAWEIQTTQGGRTLSFFSTGPNPNSLSGSRIVNDGQWHHVAVVYDGTNLSLYVDGTLDVSTPSTGSITPNHYPMGIGYNAQGAFGSPSYFFDGFVDEVSIYNRGLSANEIAAIYAAGSSGKCPQPPTIFIQPTNRSVALGGSTTFMVVASGTPDLFYQWYFNGTNIIDATNASLTLNNVQFSQAGTYMVQVANTGGSVNSSNAILTVISPPIITTEPTPTNLTVLRGSNVTFSALAIGSLPLSYQWKFNGTSISGATNTDLSLPDVQLNQSGAYAVLVTNLYGSVLSSNAILIVNPLFHFVWNHIPSPRFAGTPFAVVIQAQNPANGIATNFTDTVFLLSTNGVPVNPSVSGNFVQGVWTGAVTISQTLTNLMLEAEDSFNETGFANAISIVNLPSVGATASGGTLYIYWPTDPSGFSLETTPTLSPATWTQVPVSPILIGNQYLAPVPMSGTNAFYRLKFNGP